MTRLSKNAINRPAAIMVAMLAAVLAGGCASDAPHVEYNRFWPPTDATARYKLVQIIRGEADLRKPGFFDALGQILTGTPSLSMARPQDIAVKGQEYMYIADLKLRGIHVFNLQTGKRRFINRAEKLPIVSPVGVAACDDMVAVADSARSEVFLFTPKGRLARKIEKPGGFERPSGLAFDNARKLLYVVDTLANEVCAFSLDGQLVRRFGTRGTRSGEFNYPTYISVDDGGKIYVTDSLNFRVQIFSTDGQFLSQIGRHGDASGHLGMPKGVAVDRFGHIYIVDSYFETVQVFDQNGRFLLAIGEGGIEPGGFRLPTSLTIGSDDRIYVCDSYNARVQVLQFLGDNNAEPSSDDRANNHIGMPDNYRIPPVPAGHEGGQ